MIDSRKEKGGILLGGDTPLENRGADCPWILEGDCRDVLEKFADESIDCVVTSPPYVDLKDYGVQGQIGYGQKTQEEYYAALEGAFREVYRVCKTGASFWLIVDNVKVSGRLLPLPWVLSKIAEDCGFRLQDIVVWDKGKSLPWSHKGRFRSRSEHIFLLSKGELARFDINSVREQDELSPYWVRYPERYHPLGVAPSDIWHFPIPVQGSWKENAGRHFCPLPPRLVKRMLTISTKKNSVVLDPFSGIGTVPLVASELGRRGVGIEINRAYIEESYEQAAESVRQEMNNVVNVGSRAAVAEIIAKLRVHKFAKVLFEKYEFRQSEVPGLPKALGVVVSDYRSLVADSESAPWASCSIEIVVAKNSKSEEVSKELNAIAVARPLSKFGVSVRVGEVTNLRAYCNDEVFVYSLGNFYHYMRRPRCSMARVIEEQLQRENVTARIFSTLSLRLKKPRDS